MPSIQSRALEAYLRVTRRKRSYTDVLLFRARIDEERRTVDHAPPATLKCHIARREVEGAPCYTLSPRNSAKLATSSIRHILFLHGGCYVFEIAPEHWEFGAKLTERLGCDVTVPIYPLAPEHAADDALKMALSTYREIAKETPQERIAIMGDSAGGGMALALAQLIQKEDGLPKPKHVVLLSPWVDVALDHPDISAADARDPWLSRIGLAEAGRLYRRHIDPKDPRVSPLHGELATIGTLTILIGSRDVLHPDAKLLASKATAAGANVRFHEYEGMVHDFMILGFLPEAKRALEDIAASLG